MSLNSTGSKGKQKVLTGTSNCALQHRAKADVHLSCANVELGQIKGSLFHGFHIPTVSSRDAPPQSETTDKDTNPTPGRIHTNPQACFCKLWHRTQILLMKIRQHLLEQLAGRLSEQ